MEKSNGLPKGWETTELSTVCKVSSGIGFPKIHQGEKEGKYPFYKVGDISKTVQSGKIWLQNADNYVSEKVCEELNGNPFPKGTIAFAKIGEALKLNRRSISSTDSLFDNNVMGLIPNKNIIKILYLYYYSTVIKLENYSRATTVPSVRKGDIESIKIPLPPLNEQKRIVEKIDKLFSASKYLQNLLNKNLLLVTTLKNSTLQDAFTGKLVTQNTNDPPLKIISVIQKKNTGRKPSIDMKMGKAAISVGKSNVAPPKGWKWVPLLQLAELATGHTPKRQNPEYWNGKIQWITGGDAGKHDGDHIFETKETITQLGVENSAAVVLPIDTVCFAREASIGYCVLLGKPMATNQRFVNFICGENLMPKYLMYLFLFERNYMFRFKEGSIFGTIYFPAVKAFHICLPPLNEQKRIIAKIDLLWSFAKKIESEIILKINTLNSFEKSVLKYAFEGKLVPQDPNDEPASELLKRIKLVN